MSTAKKNITETSPESYSPKQKPEILNIAEHMKHNGVKSSANVLEGVRDISYGNPSAVCYIGAVTALMEYLKDPVEVYELFVLSGAALCFPWKSASCCDEVSIIPSIPQRTFEALGYEYEYIYEQDVKSSGRNYSRDFYINKIVASIDAGRPVIGFGITNSNPFACVITGYENNGERLFVRAYWSPQGIPEGYDGKKHYYVTEDWYENCYGLVIIGDKTADRIAGEQALRFVCENARLLKNTGYIDIQGSKMATAFGAFDEMTKWLLDDNQWQEIQEAQEVFLAYCGILLLGHYRYHLWLYLGKLPGNTDYIKPVKEALQWIDALCSAVGGEDSRLHLEQKADHRITNFNTMKDPAIRKSVAGYVQKLKYYDGQIFRCLEEIYTLWGQSSTSGHVSDAVVEKCPASRDD